MKLISLNEKINKITEVNEIKNEYRDVANVKIKEIVILINVTPDIKRNEEEKNATDNN